VALHGGSVHAESPGEGQGSRFVVRLPLAAGAAAEAAEAPLEGAPEESGPQPDTPVSVMLVEDNEDAREMLALLLEGRGFEVATAADGASGVERIQAGDFDAAVVDIGLPGLDGYEVARRVRDAEAEDDDGGRILLIALSGYGRSEDRERSAEAGFDHHLVKPVDPDELCGLLRGAG
jgi:CheY-like chemotaxis protein